MIHWHIDLITGLEVNGVIGNLIVMLTMFSAGLYHDSALVLPISLIILSKAISSSSKRVFD